MDSVNPDSTRLAVKTKRDEQTENETMKTKRNTTPIIFRLNQQSANAGMRRHRFGSFLSTALLAGAALVAVASPELAAAVEEVCHVGSTICTGKVSLAVGGPVNYQMMTVSPGTAIVDRFTNATTVRHLTSWSTNFLMTGTVGTDGSAMTLTLNENQTSTGTELSITNTEFPCTATLTTTS